MSVDSWSEASSLAAEAALLSGTALAEFLDAHCAGRPELRAELESLLRFSGAAGPLDRPPGLWIGQAAAPASPARFGPWRVTGVLGEGGMGVVYRAQRDDGQFEREAAIKQIAGGRNWDLLRRFEREREILAALDHPNIARLEDAGATADGSPFLVLELVDGQAIDNYAESCHLSLDDRCRLFAPVCRAAHYAHQRLILHRDLKPSNILVTAQGVPKLLDFGIGKLIADDAGNTAVSAFTPAYASPEQFRNQPVSTATDVYSLGAVLHTLLTGHAPFQVAGKSVPEAAAIVCDSPLPRTALGGDLDAVLAKALEKDPSARYGSAAALAEDLENYLAGRPVKARAHSFLYSARKLVWRNKALAATVALASIGMVTLSIAAVRQERLAQQRFNDVRKLADSVLTEFEPSAAKSPGTLELRRLMMQRAAQYLDRLVQHGADSDLALGKEVADAYLRLGDVEGNYSRPNLGNRAAALENYGKARSLLEAMRRRQPASTALAADLGRALNLIAQVDNSRQPEAGAYWQTAYATFPHDRGISTGFAASLWSRAIAQTDPKDKVRLLQQALAIWNLEANPAARGNQALGHRYLSSAYMQLQDPQHALSEALAAEQIDSSLSAANPSNREAKLAWSFDLSQVASGYSDVGETEKAETYYQRVLDIRTEILRQEPKDNQALDRTAYAEGALGRNELLLGRTADGCGHLQNAVALAGQAWKQAHFFSSLETAGHAHFDLGDGGQNCAEMRKGYEAVRQLQTLFPRQAAHAEALLHVPEYRTGLERCGVMPHSTP